MQENNMNTEEREEKDFLGKVKKHRKKIVIASAAVFMTITGVIIYKKCSATNVLVNKENITTELYTSKDALPMLPENTNHELINVSVPEHRRRLHEGQKHSQAKAELAALLGYNLAENETIVNPYSYQRKSA